MFTPEEASQARQVLGSATRSASGCGEAHYTPKHGSRLNAVEIEFAALSKQCLARRIPSLAVLKSEVAAWTVERNSRVAKVNWLFRSIDTRVKLVKLYPANQS